MKLTVINGSPRGKKSNTRILLDSFIQGFLKNPENEVRQYYLNKRNQESELQRNFLHGEALIIGFPLYTDCMPGIVKEYFELLEPHKKVNPGLKLGFLVQSGFKESHHSLFLSRYLEKLAGDFEADYLGCIIKGGAEGYHIMPHWMVKGTLSRLEKMGELFGQYGRFDSQIIKELSRPYRFSKARILLFHIMKFLGLTNMYWNNQLKKNGAYSRRFARPYSVSESG